MKKDELDKLRNQLSTESKNGIDFTIAATIIWAIIAFIWTLKVDSYNKSVFVFMAGGPLLPLAFILSKIFKTNWKVKDNPLQPLGLWLNFAQLFYFPFLIFLLLPTAHAWMRPWKRSDSIVKCEHHPYNDFEIVNLSF